jgi:copper(I)-binding protein
MLMQLEKPLKKGESFPMTLSFDKAGDVAIQVTVEYIGAVRAGSHEGHGDAGHSSTSHSTSTKTTP